jgi:hypothetical protein
LFKLQQFRQFIYPLPLDVINQSSAAVGGFSGVPSGRPLLTEEELSHAVARSLCPKAKKALARMFYEPVKTDQLRAPRSLRNTENFTIFFFHLVLFASPNHFN